jgi:hypothetical protein
MYDLLRASVKSFAFGFSVVGLLSSVSLFLVLFAFKKFFLKILVLGIVVSITFKSQFCDWHTRLCLIDLVSPSTHLRK